MIGNDIVDLNLAAVQNNWERKGFLDKVFTKYEQDLIFSSKIPFTMVWILWSMKESAYKIHVQQTSKRFFNPKKLQCKLQSETEGVVEVNGEKYVTKSGINNSFIHTIASLKNNKKILSTTFELDDTSYITQHKESYKKLIGIVSKKWKLAVKDIHIKKNKVGVPKLFLNNKKLSTSFSISHHGHYGAYAILN
ncbi:MAG: 4'-phosphopantetheinyl transferase superfamily protein [Flavobacteriaceae bacterium]|nr:4'-phosphopantetheinyl transferase superfamily protein [Flavobacteriaceae bacterium]